MTQGPVLGVLDEPYRGYTFRLDIGAQAIFLSSASDALTVLMEEYALSFVLPDWLADGPRPSGEHVTNSGIKIVANSRRPPFSPHPKPTSYWAEYGKEALLADIHHWGSHLIPGGPEAVEKELQAVIEELRRRQIENDGWHPKLSLVEAL